MFSTSVRHRVVTLAVAAGLLAAAATPMSANAAVVAFQSGPTLSASASTSQGIIMRDGGVCDPIRHMGC